MARDGSGAHDVSARSRRPSGVRRVENAWSPDGSNGSTTTPSTRRVDHGHIFRTDVDAQRTEVITSDDVPAYGPQLSPDGTLLSYITWDGSVSDLWVARADGSEPHLLLHLAQSLGCSNDGSVLLATSADPIAGPNGGIVTIRPDGTMLRAVLPFAEPCDVGRGGQCIDSVAWGQPRP